MEPLKTSVIITYSKFGTRPPVYVAGTFTDPEWTPQEMQYAQGSDGELVFNSQAFVTPDKEYQLKFRLGEGDWWVLDEDLPVVYDNVGNQNNLLKAPQSMGQSESTESKRQEKPQEPLVTKPEGVSKAAATLPPLIVSKPKSLSTDLASDLEVEADGGQAPLMLTQNMHPEAEAPDAATLLQNDKEFDDPQRVTEARNEDEILETNDTLRAPLFAHESLGAYEFVDDGFDHESLWDPNQRRFSKSIKDCFLSNNPDLDDPTLESFPSEKVSIFDTLRKIQTTLDDGAIHAEPFWGASYDDSSRTSFDSADDITLSPCSLSPTSTRRRDSRLSYSSVGRNRSAVSLGSIAEEDQQKSGAQNGLKPPQSLDASADSNTSEMTQVDSQKTDDDGYLMMSSTKSGYTTSHQGQDAGTKENMMQSQSMSKKSRKSKKSRRSDANTQNSDGGRHDSYPRFITNVFENSRNNVVVIGGLVVLVVGVVWLY